MKAFPWILGAAVGAVAVYVVLNPPLKQQIAGVGESLMGKVKEGLGDVLGNDGLAAEGMVNQAEGSVRNAAGAVAARINDAVHEATS